MSGLRLKETFPYGAVFVLRREYSLANIETRLAAMCENSFDYCVVWPGWCLWEEKSEYYPYATGRHILKFAQEIGLKIIMEFGGQITALEYGPDYM